MKLKIVAAAMGMAIASIVPSAGAQSTSGNIIGEAKAGDTIFITNADTGFKREVKIKKDGKYQVRNLPAGTYQVIPMHPDGSFDPSQQLDVRLGATSRALPSAKTGEANTPD
jgi:uncharacterized protein involved in high-affinity Fe2+ transport